MDQRDCLEFEKKLGHPCSGIVGVDEVGRGCLAGPVVAAAYTLPEVVDFQKESWLSEITDSKKLSAKKRENFYEKLWGFSPCVKVGVASVEEIDEINIFHASHLAMKRAIEAVAQEIKIQAVLVDGKFLPKGLNFSMLPVIKGDLRCLSISCASIVAKVWRDRHLENLDLLYPGYGLATHKGYPTPSHQEALKRLGVSIIHRKSFDPVSKLLSV